MKNAFVTPLAEYINSELSTYNSKRQLPIDGHKTIDARQKTPQGSRTLSRLQFDELILVAKKYDRLRALQDATLKYCGQEFAHAQKHPRSRAARTALDDAMNSVVKSVEAEKYPVPRRLEALLMIALLLPTEN